MLLVVRPATDPDRTLGFAAGGSATTASQPLVDRSRRERPAGNGGGMNGGGKHSGFSMNFGTLAGVGYQVLPTALQGESGRVSDECMPKDGTIPWILQRPEVASKLDLQYLEYLQCWNHRICRRHWQGICEILHHLLAVQKDQSRKHK